MDKLSIFTFGYFGWGSATLELKKMMDAVEQARGFSKPYFVDLRISRSVRAPGFRDDAFERVVGSSRYRWMKSLGNVALLSSTGPRIKIADPEAIEELLGVALAKRKARQRLIIFCSCAQIGHHQSLNCCHRAKIATMLLRKASVRNVELIVAEWPGGAPKTIKVKVADKLLSASIGVRQAIPLTHKPSLELLQLPWGSIATFEGKKSSINAIADPATCRGGQWQLPLPAGLHEGQSLKDLRAQTFAERRRFGLEARSSF